MAEENIKEFTINWIVLGLLSFCLLSFAITFMYHNNPIGLDENIQDKFSGIQSNLSSNLYSIDASADKVLNITANTNPEASELGSRDSVSSAYEMKGTGTNFFESMKILLSWILVGDIGTMLISVFGGLIGFLSVYYIVKWIRNGI